MERRETAMKNLNRLVVTFGWGSLMMLGSLAATASATTAPAKIKTSPASKEIQELRAKVRRAPGGGCYGHSVD